MNVIYFQLYLLTLKTLINIVNFKILFKLLKFYNNFKFIFINYYFI